MGFFETEFSHDNIFSYARACVDLSDYIEYYVRYGYKNVLMPSRGAYPFYKQAICNLNDSSGLPKVGFIYLPYTADYSNGNENLSYSKEIRRFWTQVLISLLKGQEDNYINYYKYLVEDVSNQRWEDKDWFCYNPIINRDETIDTQRFIYIDTVISGSSVYDIISEFERLDLDYRGILLVDENGQKLLPKFKSFLNNLYDNHGENKIIFINVNRIFTEDRGPGLGGILGIVYPDLMMLAVSKIPTFQGFDIVGSGIWFLNDNDCESTTPDWYYPRIALESMLRIITSFLRDFKRDKRKEITIKEFQYFIDQKIFDRLYDHFLCSIKNYNVLDQKTTNKIFSSIFPLIQNQREGLIRYEVTSSHLIRIYLNREYANHLITAFFKKT